MPVIGVFIERIEAHNKSGHVARSFFIASTKLYHLLGEEKRTLLTGLPEVF